MSRRARKLENKTVRNEAASLRASRSQQVTMSVGADKYRLPEEVDALFVKTLLHRIRSDLHSRGLLDSAEAPLTRCNPATLPC